MFIGALVSLLTKLAWRTCSYHQISFHLLFFVIYQTILNIYQRSTSHLEWSYPKKVLKSLKVDKITNITEIKYVSRLLRSKLRKEEQPDAFNHNDRIKENYWKYCKNNFETNATGLPTFSENDCWKHFMKTWNPNPKSSTYHREWNSLRNLWKILTSNPQHIMK